MRRDDLPEEITYGSVCSGIEAATVAWHPLGWRPMWLGEIEPFPARVLHHHYGAGRPVHMPDPDQVGDDLTQENRDARRAAIKAVSMLPAAGTGPQNLGDMTKIAAMVRARAVAAPAILVGGTPCQAFSIAGLRESLGDARGQLTLSFVDLANAIDAARHVLDLPECIIIWENVPGVLSTNDNAFGCFLAALAGEDSALLPPGGKWPNAGCVFGPQRRVAWRVLDAQYFGVAQRRRRVFVVASARDGFDPATVLFEQDGVRRDSPPSREAKEDAAGTVRASAGRRGGVQDECGLGLQAVAMPPLARCDTSGEGRRQDYETCTIVPVLSAPVARSVERPRGDGLDTLIAGTLQAGGKAAGSATQQDAEAGMLVPIAVSMKDYGGDASFDLAPTLRAGNHATSHANGDQPPAIAFDASQDCVSSTEVFGALGSSSPQAQAIAFCQNTRDEVRLMNGDGQIVGALSAQPGMKQTCYVATGLPDHGAAYSTKLHNTSSNQAGKIYREYTVSLDANSPPPALLTSMAVRRLTPRECERLQSFPDFHTLIPMKKVTAGRAETMLVKGDPVMEIAGAWWALSADGPRYKALGNSMCVFNMRWIGRRVHFALTGAWPACGNFMHEREIARVA